MVDSHFYCSGIQCELRQQYVKRGQKVDGSVLHNINTNNLSKSYLQDRFQRVLINCNSNIYTPSDRQQVKPGVPQGSMLGPLIFLLYVNDLPKTISAISNPILFAYNMSKIITNSDP
jgi:hypothetical protein